MDPIDVRSAVIERFGGDPAELKIALDALDEMTGDGRPASADSMPRLDTVTHRLAPGIAVASATPGSTGRVVGAESAADEGAEAEGAEGGGVLGPPGRGFALASGPLPLETARQLSDDKAFVPDTMPAPGRVASVAQAPPGRHAASADDSVDRAASAVVPDAAPRVAGTLHDRILAELSQAGRLSGPAALSGAEITLRLGRRRGLVYEVLADLVAAGCVERVGAGRAARFRLTTGAPSFSAVELAESPVVEPASASISSGAAPPAARGEGAASFDPRVPTPPPLPPVEAGNVSFDSVESAAVEVRHLETAELLALGEIELVLGAEEEEAEEVAL